jgi:hypothetical protein
VATTFLTWVGISGYMSDGVEPDNAVAGSSFFFMCKSAAPEAPDSVKLLLTRNCFPVAGSPFAMTASSGEHGMVYSVAVPLDQAGGSYCYRFRAYVGGVEVASLPQSPTLPQAGPTVTSGGALTLSGVTAQRISGGIALTYALSKPAAVEVTVLNIAGRPITQLVSPDVQAAGVHTLSWNGRNAAGTRVPAGTYLVQVTANAAGGGSATGLCSVTLQR